MATTLNPISGLTSSEAALRLRQFGPNELSDERQSVTFKVARDILREPMILLLIGTGLTYLLLGEPNEALALIIGIFAIIAISFYQQRRTEKTLSALRSLSSPQVDVFRDGHLQKVAARELVPGDLVLVTEGTRIPADGFLLNSINLEVDESLLTGESIAVRKVEWDRSRPMPRPGRDDRFSVFSGTLAVQGRGTVLVSTTGIHTEIGRIGKALATVQESDTTLQRQTRNLAFVLAVLGLSLCAAVAVLYGFTRGAWLQGVLAGLTLAISMVPEEFAVILTVFFALGAWRIAQSNVLTRRTAAIEALGTANVLCSDKTGTITMNRMSVVRVWSDSSQEQLRFDDRQTAEEQLKVIAFGALASPEQSSDATDRAFLDAVQQSPSVVDSTIWQRVREYPFSKDFRAMTHVWKSPDRSGYTIATKGAPETVLKECGLDDDRQLNLLAKVREMAEQGLRVLAVAAGQYPEGQLPESPRQFHLRFIGLAGLADPVRPMVPEAIGECHRAGIRVVMITGDYPATAQRIGQEIGLESGLCLSGLELAKLSDEELAERTKSINIFARVLPEQKLRLVRALQSDGSVVAMTGDGVNDAPALKAADIGIAMGGRGTDVAREAADLILLDDDFTSIVRTIRMGRRIFENLRKATGYIFALHVPIAGMSFLPVLLNWPLALFPLHVLFFELVTDPACSIAFEAEPEERDVMGKPPRNKSEPLLSRNRAIMSLFEGGSILLVVLAVYWASLRAGHAVDYSRALAFASLIAGNVSLMLSNRSSTRTFMESLRTPNPFLQWIIAGTSASLALVLYVPTLRKLFRFASLRPLHLALAIVAGAISLIWVRSIKAPGKANKR